MEKVNGLYGSEIDKSKSCAYCKYHKCHLTPKMVRQHECLNKQCFHMVKNEGHDWWRHRSAMKAKRKAKRSVI